MICILFFGYVAEMVFQAYLVSLYWKQMPFGVDTSDRPLLGLNVFHQHIYDWTQCSILWKHISQIN